MFKIQAFKKGTFNKCKRWYYSSTDAYRKWLQEHRQSYGQVYDIVGYRFRGGRWETLK